MCPERGAPAQPPAATSRLSKQMPRYVWSASVRCAASLAGLAILLCAPAHAFGQRVWTLENHAYFDPLIAEPRGANAHVFLSASDAFEFSQKPGKRFAWDITLGKEIPIVGFETESSTTGDFNPGAWGLGLWAPISFHMIEGFKDPSNPIINTDYRFSGMLKFRRMFERGALALRLNVGHESTHLGDEFSLAASRNNPDFFRINVSYEYWDFAGSWDFGEEHQFKLRGGVINLLDRDKGYYSGDLAETGGRPATPSERNTEFYGGFEYTSESDFRVLGWNPFVSVDARHKTVLDYFRPAGTEEDKQLSWNLIIGLRNPEQTFNRGGMPSYYFRLYHGVNPHGQLRNQRGYTQVGFGLFVPL